MKAQSLLVLIAAGGAGFVFAVPHGETSGPEPVVAEKKERPSRPNPWMKDDLHAATLASGPVWLKRNYDGHFYADVSVDGVERRMLVDTGATGIALTREDAEAIGVQWEDAELQYVGEGASGAVRGVPVMLDQVALGSFEFENVPAVVIPRGLSISLLGQSFLSRIDKVEITSEEMILGS